MAEHDLMTAKFLKAADEASAATAESEESPPAPNSSAAGWARATRWLSAVTAAAVVACAIGLVVPFLKTAASGKKTSPFDWLIHLKTGRSDQSFEKWVQDSATANQQEWQEKFRQSPAYQIDPAKPIGFDFQPPGNSK